MTVAGLTNHLDLDVSVESISVSFLPRPRITGANLTLRLPDHPELPPFIEIRRFWLDAGVFSILRKHVGTIHLDGLTIAVPPGNARRGLPGGGGGEGALSGVIVDHIVAHDAVLLFVPRKPGRTPLTFNIHDLTVDAVGFGREMPFTTRLTNPVPKGLIKAHGTVGPWVKDNATAFPLAGEYTFTDADMSTINGIGGTLSSTGKFNGRVTAIGVVGQADVPDFSLDLGGRPISLTTSFDAEVDGTDGTTYLKRVDARIADTPMRVSGAITNLAGPAGRQVDLDVQITDGRIEDLVALAIESSQPIMIGDVALTAKLSLPPGPSRVRERLKLAGTFGLSSTRFTDGDVQAKLQELSRRSQGKDKDDPMARVLTSLRGRFTLAGGTLALQNLSFRVPGATVSLAGSYGLASSTMDFRGTLRMTASVSKAVGGVKSIFLRPFDALFRKDGAGAVVPIKITGTRTAPKFGLEIGKIFGRD